MPVALKSKEISCDVKIGGQDVTLDLRPFTLRDLAWLQENFGDEKDALAIAQMKAEPLCKIIWHMLTPESKSFFGDVTYIDVNDDTGEQIKVKVIGYKKLFESISSSSDLLKLFVAYQNSESLNKFIPTKKKTQT